jgi:uncharacterized repeat protein (TIGR03803 family)
MSKPLVTLSRLGTCLLFAMIGGCVNNAITPFAPAASSESRAGTLKYNVLYSFNGGSDGAVPTAGLTYVNGKLYGTTGGGGAYGKGTVFALTP